MRPKSHALVAPAVFAAGVLALATALAAPEIPAGVVEPRAAAPTRTNPYWRFLW